MDTPISRRLPANLTANRLTRRLRGLRAAGRTPLDLTLSDPTQAGLGPAPEALAPLAAPAGVRYRPQARGDLPARRAVVADLLRRHPGLEPADPERVVLTASTSEAYAFLFKLLCDPGDEVLVPAPGYPLFEHLAALEGIRARPYRLSVDRRWRLDAGSLEEAWSARTRVVVLVSPHNPTGWLLCREEEAMLAARCAAQGVALIADEVFADFAFPGEPGWEPRRSAPGEEPAPSLALSGTSGLRFSLAGLSKGAGLPQMKVAWIVVGGEPELIKKALSGLEWIADVYLSVAGPQQAALPAWLQAAEGFRGQLRQRLAANRRRVMDGLDGRAGCRVLPSGGGWSAVLRLPAIRTDEEDALLLLQEHDLLVHPGYLFDFAASTCLVLSLLPAPEVVVEGIRRLAAYLERR